MSKVIQFKITPLIDTLSFTLHKPHDLTISHPHHLHFLPVNHPFNGGYVDEIKIGEPAVEFWGGGFEADKGFESTFDLVLTWS